MISWILKIGKDMPKTSFGIGCMVVLLSCLSMAVVTGDDSGKPQYGAWGFDSAGADITTKPGDDFFRYANGTWLDHTMIPSDKSGSSLRIAMTDTIETRLHDMME